MREGGLHVTEIDRRRGEGRGEEEEALCGGVEVEEREEERRRRCVSCVGIRWSCKGAVEGAI